MRDSSYRIWRIAPAVGAAAVLLAIGGRWSGWSSRAALAVLIGGAVALAVYAYFQRRTAGVTDAVAARIDDDAGFGGEVRSAHWFTSAERRDDWSTLHVDRAARRLEQTSWADLYPAPSLGRLKLTSAVLAAAAIALSVSMPARPAATALVPHGVPAADATATDAEAGGEALVLSPELLKQIEALLADVEAGKVTGAAGSITAAQLRDLLARLNKAAGKGPQDGAQGKSAQAAQAAKGPSGKDLDAVAERARRDAQMASHAPEIRDPLDALAQKLTDAAKKHQDAQQQGVAASADGKDSKGAAGGQNAANSESGGQASMQMAKDSANAGGSAVMMMSSQDNAGAAPGSGVGGSGNSGRKNGGTMPAIASALRRETLEASEDAAGQNIRTETHRQTEEGHANAAFSGAAAAAFDRGRASASPAVPEERRAAVQTYFVRKP